jgi:transcriptional regulator with XRE-family HTH domain
LHGIIEEKSKGVFSMFDEHIVATTAERLKYAIEYRHTSAAEVSKATGISRGSLSQYMTGKFSPKQDRIYVLAKHLRVAPSWLMGLDVNMEERHPLEIHDDKEGRTYVVGNSSRLFIEAFTGENESIKRRLRHNIISFMYYYQKLLLDDEDTQDYLKKYKLLTPDNKRTLNAMLDTMLMAQKNTTTADSDGGEGTQKGTPSLKQVP